MGALGATSGLVAAGANGTAPRQCNIYDLYGKRLPDAGVFHAAARFLVSKPGYASRKKVVQIEVFGDMIVEVLDLETEEDWEDRASFKIFEADATQGRSVKTDPEQPFLSSRKWRLQSGKKLKTLLDRLALKWKRNEYSWSAEKNNCQDFVKKVVEGVVPHNDEGLTTFYGSALKQDAPSIIAYKRLAALASPLTKLWQDYKFVRDAVLAVKGKTHTFALREYDEKWEAGATGPQLLIPRKAAIERFAILWQPEEAVAPLISDSGKAHEDCLRRMDALEQLAHRAHRQ